MTLASKLHHGTWQMMLCALMAVGAMLTATSCGDDEPAATVINYYVDVEERFLINGNSDLNDRYYNPRDLMEEVIHTTYPSPDAQGNDQAVIAACDELYQRYLSMYQGREDHLTCIMHLTRVKLEGTIVRQSERLRTYVIDINPVDQPQE